MDYLRSTPTAPIPPGKALVHNNVASAEPLGTNGFRAWLVEANDRRHTRREPCGCGWAAGAGSHYRRTSQMEMH
jgi:hypothetical protein